jgi:hypothetical protein
MADPKDSVAANLSSAWWRIPIYDPGPPWWFESVAEQVQHELIVEQLNTQKAILQTYVDSLGRQADILSKRKR